MCIVVCILSVSDYESISEVINSKHTEVGELGKSMTLPRCHLFKVPQVPERKSSVDCKSALTEHVQFTKKMQN